MHYFQFNIGDYASHTRHLSLLEDLAYRRLLDLYYLRDGKLYGDQADVARQIGMRDHVQEVSQVLQDFFCIAEGDRWAHERCDAEIAHFRQKSEKASNAGKASAQRRFNKRSTDVQPTNNQQPITNNQEPDKTPLNPPKGGFPCPEGVDPIDWDSLLKVRQQKRAKMTAGAYRAILKKLEKWQSEGWPPGPIVANAVERGWTTVFETDEMQKGKFHGKKKSIDGSDGLSSTARAAISVFGFDGPDYEHNPGLQNGVSKPTDGLSSFDGSDWDDGGSPF